jgi:5-methylcytosine-specific restriction endonuclease McrBC GTP-binding regulatory subunit McrB
MYGLRDLSQIMEEDEIEEEDEAMQVFEEERESWLDYSAKPYSKEYEKKSNVSSLS